MRQSLHRHFEPYKLVYAPHERLALVLASFCAWTRDPWYAGERAEKLLKYMCEADAPNGDVAFVPKQQRRLNYDVLVRHCARLSNTSIELKVLLMGPRTVGKYVPLFVPAYVP